MVESHTAEATTNSASASRTQSRKLIRIVGPVSTLELSLLRRNTATPLPGPDASRKEIYERALEMLGNTAPFDLTGHPAMSIPCGVIDGLPAGLMLVGRHLAEAAIYRAAYAFEQSRNWKEL